MSDIRNIEELKARLNGYIADAEALVKAWSQVKRVKTKSGEDFKAFKKNFDLGENVTYTADTLSIIGGNELKAHIQTSTGKYVEDEIELRPLVENAKEEISKDRIIDLGPYVKKSYDLTPDETIAAVEARIVNLQEQITSYKKQAEVVDKYASKVLAEVEKIKGIFKEADTELGEDGPFHTTLVYGLRDLANSTIR